jgi:outer membrane protein
MQTAEAQREFSALKNHFASRQTALQALSQDVESLRKLLSDDTVRMTDADRAAKETTLASKEKELQREEEDYRTDSESASQQAFQKVAQKVYSFLEGYAHQHNYSLVVERGTEATPVVWYASEEADITDALVKAYNVIEADSAPGAGSRPGGASAVTDSRLRQKESHQP